MNKTAHPTPPRRILWAILLLFRLPLGIPLMLLLGVGMLLKALGSLGEFLEDWCNDMSHQLATIFNPQAWDMLKQYKEERDRFERDCEFWKQQAALREKKDL